MRIKQLPNHVANQIAAGEVIERPASVVKELLENSLDAGAHAVVITVHSGGKELIRVTDDGAGIHPQDMPLAVASHATSKLYDFSDLECIASLGFRGEALASIASIAKFRLLSRTKEHDEGYELPFNDSKQEYNVKPAAHPIGTTIEVRQLFYNTPARRKFMRADKTEFQHIEEVVKRIALSRFDVAIDLLTEQKTVLQLRAASTQLQQQKRLTKILGKQFTEHAGLLETEISGMRLWGWVTDAGFSRSAADCQYFYINGRMVKDRLINHALRQAYQDILYQGRQPGYVLYLEMDPAELDVNVHPTKQEVRFHQSRLVHDFIFQSVRGVLEDESSIFDITPEKQYASAVMHHADKSIQTELTLPSTESVLPGATLPKATTKIIGVTHKKFLLVEEEAELRVINLHLMEKTRLSGLLREGYRAGVLQPQPLLIPVVLSDTPQRLQLVEDNRENLATLAIDVGLLSDDTLALRQLPRQLQNCNAEKLLDALVTYVATLSKIAWGKAQSNAVIDIMADAIELPSLTYAEQQSLLSLFYNYPDEMQHTFSRLFIAEELIA